MLPLVTLRHRCLAIGLMLLISNIALATHGIKHVDTNAVQCPLCICQADQSHGLVAVILQVHIIFGPQQPAIMQSVIQSRHEPSLAYFQRAPPSIA